MNLRALHKTIPFCSPFKDLLKAKVNLIFIVTKFVLLLCCQLGLAEKKILNFDFDLATSDLSDRNTNSTTFLSDDTDDNTHRSINPKLDMPRQEDVVSILIFVLNL